MSNRHEQVLQALTDLVTAALPGATVKRSAAAKPTRQSAGGDVLVRDGDAGDPEVFMSPLTYLYTRRASLEILPFESSDPAGALATMFTALGSAIEADRTLGGLADWMEPEAPSTDDTDTAGAAVLHWAEVGVLITYSATNPLG